MGTQTHEGNAHFFKSLPLKVLAKGTSTLRGVRLEIKSDQKVQTPSKCPSRIGLRGSWLSKELSLEFHKDKDVGSDGVCSQAMHGARATWLWGHVLSHCRPGRGSGQWQDFEELLEKTATWPEADLRGVEPTESRYSPGVSGGPGVDRRSPGVNWEPGVDRRSPGVN